MGQETTRGHARRLLLRWAVLGWLLPLAACTTGAHVFSDASAPGEPASDPVAAAETVVRIEVDQVSTTTTSMPPVTTTIPSATAYGLITTPGGEPLSGVTIEIGGETAVTNELGRWAISQAPFGPMTVSRPAWITLAGEWRGGASMTIEIEPFIVRGIRANRAVFERDKWDNIISLAAQSAVNTIVFDTKDESGQVLYDTAVVLAREMGAVQVVYDAVERVAEAQEQGLYTITRIVTFEDKIWSRSGEPQIVGNWVDARDEDNWTYPIALGVEACELGFDEVQFDYVRFPAGSAGGTLIRREGLTQEIRVGAIESFLEQARAEISPLGCAVSADMFAIVMSSFDDQGIGQRPEELSQHLDAISPMIYPSHYSDGWLGFDDPNEHNAEVTAKALDDGAPRIAATSLMRPWLQAFYYNAAQVLEGINEAERRGLGWMLWNVNGNYELAALPPLEEETTPEP